MKNNMKTINNFLRHLRKSAKYNLVLSKDLEEILIGLMLGDLFAERKNLKSNTRLQFKQSTVNKEYLLHLYSLFSSYCGSNPHILTWFDARPDKNKTYSSIKFWTLSLPCFNMFREIFYDSTGKKILPANLESLFTARSLAYLIMDDGYNYGKAFYICTESFTFEENNKLAEILKTKFNLNCGVHQTTNGYRLYIFSSSKEDLLNLIKPYLLKHFNYKFGLTE